MTMQATAIRRYAYVAVVLYICAYLSAISLVSASRVHAHSAASLSPSFVETMSIDQLINSADAQLQTAASSLADSSPLLDLSSNTNALSGSPLATDTVFSNNNLMGLEAPPPVPALESNGVGAIPTNVALSSEEERENMYNEALTRAQVVTKRAESKDEQQVPEGFEGEPDATSPLTDGEKLSAAVDAVLADNAEIRSKLEADEEKRRLAHLAQTRGFRFAENHAQTETETAAPTSPTQQPQKPPQQQTSYPPVKSPSVSQQSQQKPQTQSQATPIKTAIPTTSSPQTAAAVPEKNTVITSPNGVKVVVTNSAKDDKPVLAAPASVLKREVVESEERTKEREKSALAKMDTAELKKRVSTGTLELPKITRHNPVDFEQTKKLIDPVPLVTPVILKIMCDEKSCRPEEVAPPPPLYDPLKKAQEHLVNADKKLDNLGWVAQALAEPRHPSDKLIQQAIAGIKKVEAIDLGQTNSGKLTYDHKIEVEDVMRKQQAQQAYLDSTVSIAKGIVTPTLNKLEAPGSPMYKEASLTSMIKTNPGLLPNNTGNLTTLQQKIAALQKMMENAGKPKDPEKLEGPQRVIIAKALEKVGSVVDMLAHRVADLDKSGNDIFRKLYGAPVGDKDLDAVELRMVQDRALEIKERRETEIAALVRDEIRILTNEIRTQLDLLRGTFFSEVRELLYSLQKQLHDQYVVSRENDQKLLAMAQGKFSKGHATIAELLAMKPVQGKTAIDEAIASHIGKAFSKAQNLALGVWKDRDSERRRLDDDQNSQDIEENEPTQQQLQAAIAREAVAAREAIKVGQEAKQKALLRQGAVGKALSDKDVAAIRKRREQADDNSDAFADDLDSRGKLVNGAVTSSSHSSSSSSYHSASGSSSGSARASHSSGSRSSSHSSQSGSLASNSIQSHARLN